MNVAILHYHFDPGGVTRVVDSTLAAFRERPGFRYALLSGRPVEARDAAVCVIPGLDYSRPGAHPPDADNLHREVITRAREAFGSSDPDVWHVHNPALGKNAAFSGLVARLARDGCALLLHEHDFAEDFRPANHRLREEGRSAADPPFPFAPRIAYAVLNGRDHVLLGEAGIPADLRHLLPNPVPCPPAPPGGTDPGGDLFLYPVRALARKNLGEFLLLAHSLGGRFRFETTLPPTNQSYLARFNQWKRVAEDLALPVRLGAAEDDPAPFPERLARSRAVVTTSVAEGFGLSFLEPWTYGRAVVGRDLPEVTSDFGDKGLQLKHLYRRFPVPVDALPEDPAPAWREALRKAYRGFSLQPPETVIEETAADLFRGPAVDFALLGEEEQEAALRHFHRRKFVPPPAFDADSLPGSREIDTGAETVRTEWNPARYAERLAEIYRKLAEAPVEPPSQADADALLRGFLHPRRFHPHFVT